MTETSRTPLSIFLDFLHKREGRVLMMDDHHLSYAIPYGNLEGFFPSVAQDNTDFSSVVRVHRPWAVKNKHTLP